MRHFDTIATRTMALLLIGLGLFHLLSVWAYQASINREVDANNEIRLAERLIAIRRSLATQPADKREPLAHEMSGGPVDAHYGSKPLAVPRANDTAAASLFRNRRSRCFRLVRRRRCTGAAHCLRSAVSMKISFAMWKTWTSVSV